MKISIITATYNSGKTIRDTLDSVLRQDYKNYELIIKDGGSKDETLTICHEYVSKFLDVSEASGGNVGFRIITTPDKGIYDAMNQGIAAATGDVIGLLNSDDFYTSFDILKTIAKRFEAYPEIDAVYGDVHYVDEKDTTRLIRYYSSRNFRRWWMRLGFMPAHPSFYCRKSVYEKFAKSSSDLKNKTHKTIGTNTDSSDSTDVPQYFDTSYKIAADFENLLRMIFVNRIKTHYVYRDFVTMRTGGASSSGAASHKQINKDHMRAFKENGVYSNYFLISLRYCYKIVELALGRIRK